MTKKTIVVMLAVALGVAGVLSSCCNKSGSIAPLPLPPVDSGGK